MFVEKVIEISDGFLYKTKIGYYFIRNDVFNKIGIQEFGDEVYQNSSEDYDCVNISGKRVLINLFVKREDLPFSLDFGEVKCDFTERRDSFEQILKSMDNYRNVTIIHGVRRTGKSVLMNQLINKLTQNGEKVARIILSDPGQNTYSEDGDLTNTVKKDFTGAVKKGLAARELQAIIQGLLTECVDYLFIDEITYLNESLNFLNLISDGDAFVNKNLILSGTDSACFIDVMQHGLFDRCNKFNTSFISFTEFSRLFGATDILEYVRCGGVMKPSKDYHYPGNIRDYVSMGYDYIGSAIRDNLFNALNYTRLQNVYPTLTYEFIHHRSSLNSLIFNWLQVYSQKATVAILVKLMQSADIGNMVDFLTQQNIDFDSHDLENYLNKKIFDRLFYDEVSDCDQTLLSELKRFLTEIGCLVEYQNTEFLCPIALRYGYSIDAVITITENFNAIKEYFSEDVDLDYLKRAIFSGVEGELIESVINLELIKRELPFLFSKGAEG